MVCILSSEGYNVPHHLMSFFMMSIMRWCFLLCDRSQAQRRLHEENVPGKRTGAGGSCGMILGVSVVFFLKFIFVAVGIK